MNGSLSHVCAHSQTPHIGAPFNKNPIFILYPKVIQSEMARISEVGHWKVQKNRLELGCTSLESYR
jgi:hypothetical protein